MCATIAWGEFGCVPSENFWWERYDCGWTRHDDDKPKWNATCKLLMTKKKDLNWTRIVCGDEPRRHWTAAIRFALTDKRRDETFLTRLRSVRLPKVTFIWIFTRNKMKREKNRSCVRTIQGPSIRLAARKKMCEQMNRIEDESEVNVGR